MFGSRLAGQGRSLSMDRLVDLPRVRNLPDLVETEGEMLPSAKLLAFADTVLRIRGNAAR